MKKSFLVVSMLLSAVAAFANDNVLQTIQIEPIRDTYNVVLISDKAVDVKKSVEATGSVLTVYSGTTEIDSVIVTPKGNEEVEIRIKGDNVERATVTFDSLAPIVKVASAPKKEIVLSKPMKTYDSVISETEEFDITPSSIAPFGQKILNGFKRIYSDKTNRGIINFGLLAMLLFYGIKLVRSKETEEIKVGLAQGLAEREINLYKPMQTPVANNFTSATQKPYTSVNYGLNAYRNVNKNPYDSVSTPKIQRSVSTPIQRPVAQQRPQATAMVAENRESVGVATKPVTKTNIDNVKFLETMTAIYEKSGRYDLAQGIKANLSKVK